MLTTERLVPRFRPPVRTAAAAGLAASFLLLGGCGGGGTEDDAAGDRDTPSSSVSAPSPGTDSAPASASPEIEDFGCLSPEQAKTGSVKFTTSGGEEVEAFASGTGRTALVLAHQADGDVCQWVPKAMELAADGYRVVAVDSAGSDVAELTAAVAWVRSEGAAKVLLVGASKGGTAVLSAAGSITPAVDAVAALSAPAAYSGMDASWVVPKLTMPLLYMASELDQAFPDDAKALSRASTKAAANDLYIVDGGNHGVSMLDVDENYAKVKMFLKDYGG